MLSAQEYRSAVEEFDRLWSTGSVGECKARMDALLMAIEQYEVAMESANSPPRPEHGARSSAA